MSSFVERFDWRRGWGGIYLVVEGVWLEKRLGLAYSFCGEVCLVQRLGWHLSCGGRGLAGEEVRVAYSCCGRGLAGEEVRVLSSSGGGVWLEKRLGLHPVVVLGFCWRRGWDYI